MSRSMVKTKSRDNSGQRLERDSEQKVHANIQCIKIMYKRAYMKMADLEDRTDIWKFHTEWQDTLAQSWHICSEFR